jgi:hypothetical protein
MTASQNNGWRLADTARPVIWVECDSIIFQETTAKSTFELTSIDGEGASCSVIVVGGSLFVKAPTYHDHGNRLKQADLVPGALEILHEIVDIKDNERCIGKITFVGGLGVVWDGFYSGSDGKVHLAYFGPKKHIIIPKIIDFPFRLPSDALEWRSEKMLDLDEVQQPLVLGPRGVVYAVSQTVNKALIVDNMTGENVTFPICADDIIKHRIDDIRKYGLPLLLSKIPLDTISMIDAVVSNDATIYPDPLGFVFCP